MHYDDYGWLVGWVFRQGLYFMLLWLLLALLSFHFMLHFLFLALEGPFNNKCYYFQLLSHVA
jgi:hypothetical protein